MKKLLLILVLSLGTLNAHAAVIVAVSNDKVPMPINAELGTLVQFPKPIKTVTPSKFFLISDVAPSDSMQKIDVKTFQIKPTMGARPEEVVFVQVDGQPITLTLVPARGASKFYEVQLDGGSVKSKSSKFLIKELSMMEAMLQDEPGGFGRETLDKSISTEIEGISFRLKRVYSAPLFTGYVFTVRNKGSVPITINLESMRFDKPNRAILGHLDNNTLVPCPLIGREPNCETALRVVLRGQKTEIPMLGQIFNGNAPHMKALPEAPGGNQ